MYKSLHVPLSYDEITDLRAGDRVWLSGLIYTARDAAHKRMFEALESGEQLPVDVSGQIIYYVGPTPAKPGQVIGSAGPTTAGRMDKYTPALLEFGLKGMIGKGKRNDAVKNALSKHKAVYFAAIGGAGALLSKTIKSSKLVAYEDLGAEAIFQIVIEKFPVIVINDIYGGDLYEQG